MTAAVDEQAIDDMAPQQRRRMADRNRELADLLGPRPDLWGVYGPADVTVEFMLWSA